MGPLVPDETGDDVPVCRGVEADPAGPDPLQQGLDGVGLSESGEALEDGAVREGVVSEAGLLGGPVEEAEGERGVGDQERVDHAGDELRG